MKATLGASDGPVNAMKEESFIIAAANGAQARIIENICSQVEEILESQGLSISLADHATWEHFVSGSYPDVSMQSGLSTIVRQVARRIQNILDDRFHLHGRCNQGHSLYRLLPITYTPQTNCFLTRHPSYPANFRNL